MSACTKHAAEPVRGYRDCPGCEVESLRQQLAAAQAELSADAKWQAVIDQIADDEDRMHEQIELWARQSYRRSRSGVRGTTITRADSEVTHYVWAALRWAHEREQAEARGLRAELARVREIVSGMREYADSCDHPSEASKRNAVAYWLAQLEDALSQPAELDLSGAIRVMDKMANSLSGGDQ